jgi:hypothetical protein
MKQLSAFQAQSCEEAKQPKCVCRCGGTLHGGKRGNVCTFAWDDPHYPGKPCATCVATGKCPWCSGTGKRELYGSGQMVPCWYCEPNGSGKCKKCAGTGGVLRKGSYERAEEVRGQ